MFQSFLEEYVEFYGFYGSLLDILKVWGHNRIDECTSIFERLERVLIGLQLLEIIFKVKP